MLKWSMLVSTPNALKIWAPRVAILILLYWSPHHECQAFAAQEDMRKKTSSEASHPVNSCSEFTGRLATANRTASHGLRVETIASSATLGPINARILGVKPSRSLVAAMFILTFSNASSNMQLTTHEQEETPPHTALCDALVRL